MESIRRTIALTLAPVLVALAGAMTPSNAHAISMTCLLVSSSAIEPPPPNVSQPRALVSVLAPSWPDVLLQIQFYIHHAEATNIATQHMDFYVGFVPAWVYAHAIYTLQGFPPGAGVILGTGIRFGPYGLNLGGDACAADGVI